MSGEEFGLVQSFHIDDGQLDGLPDHKIFVLGVRFQKLYGDVQNRIPLNLPVSSLNKERVSYMLVKHNYTFEFEETETDEWYHLIANPRELTDDR